MLPTIKHSSLDYLLINTRKSCFREAREELAKRIAEGVEKPMEVYSYKATPRLKLKLPEATPEAFNMVLNYIYTDRIDPTEKG